MQIDGFEFGVGTLNRCMHVVYTEVSRIAFSQTCRV